MRPGVRWQQWAKKYAVLAPGDWQEHYHPTFREAANEFYIRSGKERRSRHE